GNGYVTADDIALVFEPYWQNNSPDDAPVTQDAWNSTSTISGTSLFWASSGNTNITPNPNCCGGQATVTFADVLDEYPNAILANDAPYSFVFNIGTYNQNTISYLDNVIFDVTGLAEPLE